MDFGQAALKVNGKLRKVAFFVKALPGMSSPLVLADAGASGEYGRDFTWSQVVSHTNGQLRVVSETFDSNGNGLPDWWEERYFEGPTSADALADDDSDGMTNLQEFLAGTDPLDAASALRLQVMGREAGGWRFSFESVAGKNYRVEASADLLDWQPLGEIIPGTGQVVEVLDESATGVASRFYRVKVVP